jgi:hypothetical protein
VAKWQKWQSGSKGGFDATFFKSGRVAAKEFLTPLFLKVAKWQSGKVAKVAEWQQRRF